MVEEVRVLREEFHITAGSVVPAWLKDLAYETVGVRLTRGLKLPVRGEPGGMGSPRSPGALCGGGGRMDRLCGCEP